MKPYYDDGKGIVIYNGDNASVMPTLAENSVDAIVTDPPYGISFMGKRWDYDIPTVDQFAECLRVLKPGGHLLCFCGTRTQHRMAVNIEDAGFEMRDVIAWVYGSGFPKSLDVGKAIDKAAGAEREIVGWKIEPDGRCMGTEPMANKRVRNPSGKSDRKHGADNRSLAERKVITAPATEAAKQWDGWGTALKPSMELITVARKPLIGTVAANVLKYGTGALNVDACRIEGDMGPDRADGKPRRTDNTKYGKANEVINPQSPLGRWPANTIHDGSEEVCELFPETVSGSIKPHHLRTTSKTKHAFGERAAPPEETFGDSGSAARFFQTCEYSEMELNLCKAKAILSAWNHDLANTADDSTNLPSGHVASALNDAAILASHGRLGLSELREHSTLATPRELRRLCEAAIAAILSIEKSAWQEQQRERHIGNGCRVKYVEAKKQIGTTTITISHWKSDGSAGNVTLSITQPCLDHGEAGSASRFRYTAKADKTDRDGTKHPTVKPIDLMRYLVRLVCPVGGIVLDPWCGSGTTVYAARAEHCKAIGIERELEYVTDAANRLRQGVLDFGGDV